MMLILNSSLPTSKAHMASETLERFDIGICLQKLIRGSSCIQHQKAEDVRLTCKNVAFKMFVSCEGLPAICAEDHDGGFGKSSSFGTRQSWR